LPVRSGFFVVLVLVVLVVLVVLAHEVMLWLGAHGATPFLFDRDTDSVVHVLTIVNVISLPIGMSRATDGRSPRGDDGGMVQPAVLVYDGDCAFCQRCIDVGTRVLPRSFRCEPFQFLDLGALGLTDEQVRDSVWWVQPSLPARGGHRAVAALLQAQIPWWWRSLGWVIDHPPVSPAARWIYSWVARNRYRLPGGTAQCRVPQPPAGRHARAES
jgi:predicted DCC family thiol-disulfide oxidoreductase YuxK